MQTQLSEHPIRRVPVNNRLPMLGTTCQRVGHAPPEVEHLAGQETRIRCSRCGKTVYEYGLADHPEVVAGA